MPNVKHSKEERNKTRERRRRSQIFSKWISQPNFEFMHNIFTFYGAQQTNENNSRKKLITNLPLDMSLGHFENYYEKFCLG